MAGVVFATVISDDNLALDVRVFGLSHGLTPADMDALEQFAQHADSEPPIADAKVRAALLLARVASPSPAAIDSAVLSACRDSGLTAPAIVELVTWLSVLQMLHRLSCFYSTEPLSNGTAAN